MIVNGTTYHKDTPADVVRVLENARASGDRIRIRDGETKTGRDWLEEWGVEGRVGRSMGPDKIPILLHNRRSMGGGAILDHCIVRIIDMKTKRVLYSHPKYYRPELVIRQAEAGGYEKAVYADGKLHAQFKTREQANRWINKMSL